MRWRDLPLADRLRLQSRPTENECVEWTGTTIWNGYGRIWANGKKTLAHRAAWELVNGPIPDGQDCLHRCDNRPCIKVAHLFLGTDSENQQDSVVKGRHPTTKLTPDEVREIRRRSIAGTTHRTLALVFGVTPPEISLIVNRKRWAHI